MHEVAKIKFYGQIICAFLVIIFFVVYGALYQEKKFRAQGYGETDFAIYYVVGASVLRMNKLAPTELYNTKVVRPLVQKLRGHLGGTHYIYPPLVAALFAPFSLFPYQTAYKIWLWLNCLFFVLAFYLSVLLLDNKIYAWKYSLILFCLSFSDSLLNLLRTGQVNGLILLLIILSLWLIHKNKWSFISAGSLILALFLKIIPFILVPYFMIKRKWKLLLWSLIIFSGLVLVSIIGFSWTENKQYFNDIFIYRIVNGDVGNYLSDSSLYGSMYLYAKQATPHFFGLTKNNFITILDLSHKIITLVFFGLIIFLIWKSRKEISAKILVMDYGLLILFVLLFSKGTHSSFNLLILPVALLLMQIKFNFKNALLIILGIIILYYSQFWGVAPWINSKTFFIFRPANFGIFCLFLTLIYLKFYWIYRKKWLI